MEVPDTQPVLPQLLSRGPAYITLPTLHQALSFCLCYQQGLPLYISEHHLAKQPELGPGSSAEVQVMSSALAHSPSSAGLNKPRGTAWPGKAVLNLEKEQLTWSSLYAEVTKAN